MASRDEDLWRELGIEPPPKLRQGFASESAESVREKGRKGGKAAQASGKAHRFAGKEAREAGRRGATLRWAAWRAARAMAESQMLEAFRAKFGISGPPREAEIAEAQAIAKMSTDVHREAQQVQGRMKVSKSRSSLAEKIAAMALRGREPSAPSVELRDTISKVEAELVAEVKTKGAPVELSSKEKKLEDALLRELEDPFGLG